MYSDFRDNMSHLRGISEYGVQQALTDPSLIKNYRTDLANARARSSSVEPRPGHYLTTSQAAFGSVVTRPQTARQPLALAANLAANKGSDGVLSALTDPSLVRNYRLDQQRTRASLARSSSTEGLGLRTAYQDSFSGSRRASLPITKPVQPAPARPAPARFSPPVIPAGKPAYKSSFDSFATVQPVADSSSFRSGRRASYYADTTRDSTGMEAALRRDPVKQTNTIGSLMPMPESTTEQRRKAILDRARRVAYGEPSRAIDSLPDFASAESVARDRFRRAEMVAHSSGYGHLSAPIDSRPLVTTRDLAK